MARSSILGIDRAPAEAGGRDKASLGPGDNSDSGSDVVGLDDDPADPGLPVDVALRDGQPVPLPLGESTAADDGDAGVRDGADIGVDRVFTPGEPAADDPEAAADALDAAATGEDEEEEATQPPAGRGEDDDEAALPGGPDAAGRRPGRG